jgi:hypothetical protein
MPDHHELMSRASVFQPGMRVLHGLRNYLIANLTAYAEVILVEDKALDRVSEFASSGVEVGTQRSTGISIRSGRSASGSTCAWQTYWYSI